MTAAVVMTAAVMAGAASVTGVSRSAPLARPDSGYGGESAQHGQT
jgi:hypothetical protein